jgi:hypothetical protein
MLAIIAGLQLFDLPEIDDGRAMNADELGAAEPLRDTPDTGSSHVRLESNMKPDVVAAGFDPINVGGIQKYEAAAGFDDEAARVLKNFRGCQQIQDPPQKLPIAGAESAGPDLARSKIIFIAAGVTRIRRSPVGREVVQLCHDDGHPGFDLRRNPLENTAANLQSLHHRAWRFEAAVCLDALWL